MLTSMRRHEAASISPVTIESNATLLNHLLDRWRAPFQRNLHGVVRTSERVWLTSSFACNDLFR